MEWSRFTECREFSLSSYFSVVGWWWHHSAAFESGSLGLLSPLETSCLSSGDDLLRKWSSSIKDPVSHFPICHSKSLPASPTKMLETALNRAFDEPSFSKGLQHETCCVSLIRSSSFLSASEADRGSLRAFSLNPTYLPELWRWRMERDYETIL